MAAADIIEKKETASNQHEQLVAAVKAVIANHNGIAHKVLNGANNAATVVISSGVSLETTEKRILAEELRSALKTLKDNVNLTGITPGDKQFHISFSFNAKAAARE